MTTHKHCQDPNCSPACEPAKQPVRDATIRRDAIPDMPEEHERFVRAGVRLGEVGQERDKFAARNAELVAALKACVDGTPDFYGIAQGLLDDLDAEAAGKQTAPAGEATRAAPADVKQHPVTAMGGESYGYDRLWNGSSWVSLAGAEAKGRLEAFAEALAQWPNLNRGCAENLFEGWLREKAAGK